MDALSEVQIIGSGRVSKLHACDIYEISRVYYEVNGSLYRGYGLKGEGAV